MPASPNPVNYFEGKGQIKWTPDGGTERDLGNCLSFSLSPTFETREHKNFRSGSTVIDVETVTSKKLTLTMQLDEITPENLALFLFGGAITVNGSTNKEFALLAASQVKGQIQLIGTNDTGSKYTVTLPVVTFTPTGKFDFIGEDYGTIELTGNVNFVNDTFGTVEETAEAA